VTKRVLIVDDEFGIVEALTDVLGEEGYAVTTARNGRDGLKRIAEVKPDLLIVDYMMPVMDGLELIEELKAHKDGAIPIILMTAVKKDQLPTGFKVQAILQKPFGVDELLELVKQLIE
jgi:DNA-binding response OmpR family regulator